jgi:hypothetical protein
MTRLGYQIPSFRFPGVAPDGIDGFTPNSIVNGHVPGRVSLLGETLSAVATARARS